MSFVNNAAYEIPNFYIGIQEANIDMSTAATYQYAAVDVVAASGTGLLGEAGLQPPAAGKIMLGILQNNPQLAEAGQVMCQGVSKVKAGGTFAIGDILTPGLTGVLVKASTGDFGVAEAMQAGSNGIIVSAYLRNFGKQ